MASPNCICGIRYSDCAVPALNCYLYLDAIGTPAALGFFSDGTNCYETDVNGKIISVTTCPPVTTCAFADVYIDPADCAASDDNTVYCTYNQCNGGGTFVGLPFACASGTGWIYGAFCYDFSLGGPTFYILVGGIEQVVITSYAEFGGDCQVTTTTTTTTTTGAP